MHRRKTMIRNTCCNGGLARGSNHLQIGAGKLGLLMLEVHSTSEPGTKSKSFARQQIGIVAKRFLGTILWMHLEKNTTILITSQKYKSLSLPMSSLPGRVSQRHLTDGQGGILTTPHAVAGTIWALANVSNCIKNLILIVNHCWLLVLGRNMCAH